MANEHSGHRKRMKKRYLDYGLDIFEIHEILEVVLYYAIPMKDTNPIAHNLIKYFGTISSVFDAPPESLIRAGLSKNSAAFVKLIPELLSAYMDDRYNNNDKILNISKLNDKFIDIFNNKSEEVVYLILTDSKLKELYCGVVSEGTAAHAEINIPKICELAVRFSARNAVIAHNHPSGIALPSKTDIKVTTKLYQALKLINVELMDHYIVASDDCLSLSESNLFFKTEQEYFESGFSDIESVLTKRCPKKCSANSLADFEYRDILQTALHYPMPKKDTGLVADNLIKKFGSFSSIFDAPFEFLLKSGLTENAAVFIKLIPDLLSVYMDDKYSSKNKVINAENLPERFINKYLGKNNEMVYLLLMDSKFKELYCGIISKGSVTNADVNVPKICELAIRHSARFAIIAHNHPSGICLPSKADIKVTVRLYRALKLLNIDLLDHYIVAEDDCISLHDANLLFKTEEEYLDSGLADFDTEF